MKDIASHHLLQFFLGFDTFLNEVNAFTWFHISFKKKKKVFSAFNIMALLSKYMKYSNKY